MKSALLFAMATVMAATAHAQESGANRLLGKWTWTRAENACTEVYDYRPDGTLQVQSGAETTDNTYSIASTPDENGFFKTVLKIVKDHGGKDCADSEEDSSGQEQTVYILFHSTKALHAICRDPSLEACYGPLHRATE